ncbi:ester cyclase [Thalassococcus sp. CAU 1522]|uniref:Ester cyclase n=1 Tax=Thalassococcus arenae TaxID=2851652 RepID=A0ABS6N2S0_9RHOB|nr:nuclear transport factor 2 family protein [Thalassococcus arenae]MBV2358321.1 ester cyclase [Thalassococcus arenae]
MKGFDEKFRDFPDYILTITREIWEDRGLGARMKDYYHPQVIVRMPGGISFGEPGMTAATMATLAEFPDRILLGEDVIWSGNPQVGMLSSHRILSTATHRGSGAFGAATGRKVKIRAIADCYAKANQISDEWLIRDNGGLVRQLGFDPRDWARERVSGLDPETQPFRPEVDVTGPYTGRGNDNEWGQALADILTRIMAGELSVITGQYDRACHLEYPGAVTGHGWDAADAFWLGLRSSFPSAVFTIHHQIGLADANMPPRAAIRWSLDGTHDGWGAFGKPTGAKVHVMGISHAEFGPWGLRREWTLLDETAIWMQILRHEG